MSGLDVEALLDSTAANDAKDSTTEHDDRHRSERSERRDRDKYRDGSRDRERDRKRRDRSREHRRDRDRDRDDDLKSPRSDHGSANGSHRSKRRSRSRDDDRRRSKRDDEHRRHRSRSPEYDRYYRPGGRSRRDDGDDRRDRNKERQRSTSPKKESKGKTPEAQLTEDERDRRTVFVQQLAARLRTKELIQFFEKVGPVKEAQIVKDRVSGRSKGVGYVEFKDESSVPLAIQMTGQKLLGIPIIAQLTEAEKNRQARNPEASSSNHNSVPFHRLYVGNIHFSITEQDLQNVFEPFGELEFVQLQKDEGGRSRGYGFVQFRDPTQAREALEKMNGFDLAGRPIRVGLGNDKFTPESTANLLQRFQGQNHPGYQGSAFSGSGGRGSHAGGSGGNFDRAGGRDTNNEKGTGGASALDDTDVAGVNFNNYSRDALMRKLARTDDSTTDAEKRTVVPKKESKPLPVNVSQASRCVLLRNMFDPTEEEGEAWIKELEDDVRAECEEKYGHVVHISLDPNTQGDIYLKFDRVSGGENAIKGLNGRYFGGRQISAQPVVDAVYSSLFSRTKAL
ncbi:Phosphatidylinositol-3-phosphatase SAC1 [Elasticomyces elasticus]|uniref:Phosphatidylinositol-3-phosphatase SAC1 n=1 Tax=Exophiala sideris TaxID=1016849 RepID=A0A0D1YF97_9EURO|nr:Phosphatidylinositol-3-phosphatase SAC1 [Elasticomyces elasticus]KAK5022312.1 Phosphatidylinositol-3-phosphatase SAC1 [Exophiala sideris]KAK5177664.1 Phosphatidylinositol-3-phosphatase SAC1 [Eurotiomycetes sp. CCFEE 6388]KAK5027124.1 Phosphatidylinositol-3-phosphatase SAC1 [Exophiala sideris]KAK5051699.1 Phosphatidylinositol-3-phosphatase SAC1 [Exophiala sideris]